MMINAVSVASRRLQQNAYRLTQHSQKRVACQRRIQAQPQQQHQLFMFQHQQQQHSSCSHSLIQRCRNNAATASNNKSRHRCFSNHKEPLEVEAAVESTAAATAEGAAAELKGVQDHLRKIVQDPSSLERFSKELTLAQQQSLTRMVAPTAGGASTTTTTTAAAAAATTASTANNNKVPEPTWRDLQLVALNTSIPFIGFGFMDNAILIVAGDAIDHSLGVWLGISTMCAAAIGNIVSDVAGVMLGTAVEDFCAEHLHLPVPSLSTAQRQLRSVRFANQFGCAMGLIVGCVIGMFPLWFLDSNRVQARKRQAAMDSLFQDVVTEARGLINAQRTRLYLVCQRPSGKKQHELILPTANGDYLYARYSQQVGGRNASAATTSLLDGTVNPEDDATQGLGDDTIGDNVRTKKDDKDDNNDKDNDDDSSMMDERWIPLGRGIVSRAAMTGEVWNVDDVTNEPDYNRDLADASQDFEPRNMLCVPVLDGNGHVIAVLQALNKLDGTTSANNGSGAEQQQPPNRSSAGGPSFSTGDVQTLQALASHISVSLQRMYYEASEGGAEEEELSLKHTIQILKGSGLVMGGGGSSGAGGGGGGATAVGPSEGGPGFFQSPPPGEALFPEDK